MALSKITNASVADNAIHGRRNLLTNSGFKIAQRGTSFTSSSVNEYSLDRWRTEGYGLSTVISQQSFTAGQTDVPDFPTNYVRVTTNTAIPSGQFWSFQQRIEKPQVMPIGTQNFTLSFWAKSVSGTISASAFSFGISGNKVNCPEITTSWQKITTTINRAVSSSNAYESLYLVHLVAGASAISIDIANVQLEIGSQSTPFEHRSYAEELELCKRFYQTVNSLSSYSFVMVRHTAAGNYYSGGHHFSPELRAAPSITFSTSGQFIHKPSRRNDTGSSAGTVQDKNQFTIIVTPTTNDTDAYLAYLNGNVTLDAEL